MTTTPTIVQFDTEDALQEYAEALNEGGTSPDVAILDSNGVQVLACRTAPGGDGWGFAYYSPDEIGFMHCCQCADHLPKDCDVFASDWKPAFPVYAMEKAS